jgi:hypothetical protein
MYNDEDNLRTQVTVMQISLVLLLVGDGDEKETQERGVSIMLNSYWLWLA